ncbi:MAG: 7TM diverse intracellular signaling domain-containing protein [Bacteroidia bacterium]
MLYILLFLWFPNNALWAKPISINSQVQIFKTLPNVSAQKAWSMFTDKSVTLEKNKTSFGFSNHIYWAVIEKKQINPNYNFLVVRNPNIDSISVFTVRTKESKPELIGISGDKVSYSTRSLPYKLPTFKINPLDPGYLLLKIDKRNASVNFPLLLWQKKSLELITIKQNTYYGFGFGILLILAFFSILIGLNTRQKEITAYGFYVSSMFVYLFISLGLAFQFTYPENTTLNNNLRTLSLLIVVVATVFFNKQYFRTNTLSKLLKNSYNFVIIGFLVLLGLWWPLHSTYASNAIVIINIMYGLILIHIVSVIFTIIKLFKRQKRDVLFYLGAFTFLIIGSIFSMFIEYGLIETSFFATIPIIYGIIAEIIVLSVGLSFRYKNLYIEKQNLSLEYNNHLNSIKTLNQQNKALTQEIEHLSQNRMVDTHSDFVTIGRSHLKVLDIKYIMVDGRYCNIYLRNKENPVLERITLKDIAQELDAKQFIRAHRSILVNLNYISKLQTDSLKLSTGEVLPLGRSYKKDIQQGLLKT